MCVDLKAENQLATLRTENPEHRTSAILSRYSRSVAFVLAECWLEVDGVRKTFTTDKTAAVTSGTAFLVSDDGYLLTNRHVVSPWSQVAGELDKRIAELRKHQTPFRLGVNYWLWFDGETAFRSRSASVAIGSQRIEDIYRIDTAYASSGGGRKLRVAGVMPLPADPAIYLNSTLDGNAIGIVSALYQQDGRAEPSMGWLLPMEIAHKFLETVRSGKPVWNGLPEASLEPEVSAAKNPWYASTADSLLEKRDAAELMHSNEGRRPETITLAVALGLRAERDKDTKQAIEWYTQALDTSQTHRGEFRVARHRRKALRK